MTLRWREADVRQTIGQADLRAGASLGMGRPTLRAESDKARIILVAQDEGVVDEEVDARIAVAPGPIESTRRSPWHRYVARRPGSGREHRPHPSRSASEAPHRPRPAAARSRAGAGQLVPLSMQLNDGRVSSQTESKPYLHRVTVTSLVLMTAHLPAREHASLKVSDRCALRISSTAVDGGVDALVGVHWLQRRGDTWERDERPNGNTLLTILRVPSTPGAARSGSGPVSASLKWEMKA